jgi:glycosyltransferase involved in cell wall biosynthesis
MTGTSSTSLAQRRLAICLISDDFRPAATGVGLHVQSVGSELARRGHQVSVVTTRREGEPSTETWEGLRLHRVFTVKIYDFYQALPSVATLQRILTREGPDLIHHHYAGFLMHRMSRVARAMRIPQVSTYHFSAEVLTQPLPMRPFRRLIRQAMVSTNNRCDAVISPSTSVTAAIRDMGICVPLHTISNPVVFGNIGDVKPAERQAGLTVLYAGRLGPEKNVGYLLSAFKDVLNGLPDARLWLAGQGPMRAQLKRRCDELAISNSVEFLGFLDHPALSRHYAACDAFVLPSLVEAQPMAVLEAMWFGKPVIVTDRIVSAREIVEHGVTGYVAAAADPASLSSLLMKLARDPAFRARMGVAARARVEAYRPEAIVDKLEDMYYGVVGKTALATSKPLLQ